MPVTLPDPQLPGDPQDALQSIQRNLEALARVIVGTSQIADGAVTGDKIADSTTGAATFSNGAATTSTLSARKYADGLVVLSGAITNSVNNVALSPSVVYATLPTGYRPAATMSFSVPGSGRAEIATNGQIQFIGTTTGITIYFDGIAFHAA